MCPRQRDMCPLWAKMARGRRVPNRGTRCPLCAKVAQCPEQVPVVCQDGLWLGCPRQRGQVSVGRQRSGSPWARICERPPLFQAKVVFFWWPSGQRCAGRSRPSRLRGERVSRGEWWGSPPCLRADSDSGLKPRGVHEVSVEEKVETQTRPGGERDERTGDVTCLDSSPREDPVLQDFHRTCLATSGRSRSGDCQGDRTEGSLRQGGVRRREPSADLDVRRDFSPCACPSSARRAGVSETDRRAEEGRDLWRAAQTQIPREPQGVWCADGPPFVKAIPPMPTDHQELQGWISEGNCDPRNALVFSDSATVAKVGSLLCHSTARFRVAGRSHGRVDKISPDGIEESDAKRRVEVPAMCRRCHPWWGNHV